MHHPKACSRSCYRINKKRRHQSRPEEEEEEEEAIITSGNWRGKHNSLSRGAGADPPALN